MNEHKVKITPQGVELNVAEGEDLLTALRKADIYVKSSCGGHASCSDCLIKITEGFDNLNEPSFDETKLIGNVFHITKERLCCQTMVSGPIEIDLSSHDNSVDAEKLAAKSKKLYKSRKSGVKVRSKEEVSEMYRDRAAAKKEKLDKQNSWQKHWEKEGGASGRGGSKRPKSFRTDHLDDVDHDKNQQERLQKQQERQAQKSKDDPKKD